jgi:hypothetical protein
MEAHLSPEAIASFRHVARQAAAAAEAVQAAEKRERRRGQGWGQWAKSFVVSSAPAGAGRGGVRRRAVCGAGVRRLTARRAQGSTTSSWTRSRAASSRCVNLRKFP